MRSAVPTRASLAMALALLLGGCAAASSGADSTPRGHAELRCERLAGAARWEGMVRASGSRVTLNGHDDFFAPTCIEVPWNTPVTLVVTNFGHMPHTVTIRTTSVDADLDAGQTAFVKVPATTVPLHVVCTFHIAQRMFAEIIPVKPRA